MEDAVFALYAMLLCFEPTEPRNASLTICRVVGMVE